MEKPRKDEKKGDGKPEKVDERMGKEMAKEVKSALVIPALRCVLPPAVPRPPRASPSLLTPPTPAQPAATSTAQATLQYVINAALAREGAGRGGLLRRGRHHRAIPTVDPERGTNEQRSWLLSSDIGRDKGEHQGCCQQLSRRITSWGLGDPASVPTRRPQSQVAHAVLHRRTAKHRPSLQSVQSPSTRSSAKREAFNLLTC